MSIPKLILATVTATAGVALLSPGAVGAESDVDTAKTLLDELCVERGGDPVWTPYSISRCQFARANKGFEPERLICEDLADGEFNVGTTTTKPNRASWGCFATSPAE